jgi:hypothetical protein
MSILQTDFVSHFLFLRARLLFSALAERRSDGLYRDGWKVWCEWRQWLRRIDALRKTVIPWEPKYSQFYSRPVKIPRSGNYSGAGEVLHAEDTEMSRNSNLHRTRRFKLIWARQLKLLTKLGVAAVALGALATGGNAQDRYQGKFTLTAETHWGTATLPAGDYTFALPSTSSPYRLFIQGQGVTAIIQATTVDQSVASERPQLNLVDIADVHTVQTFKAPALGLTFSYWTPRLKKIGRKGAGQEAAPQASPRSQVSENKSSIAVYSANR